MEELLKALQTTIDLFRKKTMELDGLIGTNRQLEANNRSTQSELETREVVLVAREDKVKHVENILELKEWCEKEKLRLEEWVDQIRQSSEELSFAKETFAKERKEILQRLTSQEQDNHNQARALQAERAALEAEKVSYKTSVLEEIRRKIG